MTAPPRLGSVVAPPEVDQDAVLGGYLDMAGSVVVVLSDDEAGLAARRWFASNPAWLRDHLRPDVLRPIDRFEFRTP